MGEREQRRRELGIPVHTDAEHDWRADGYCNCGAEKPGAHRGPVKLPKETKGKTNLDYIERNPNR